MIYLLIILLGGFGIVVFFGAPYVPTHSAVLDTALQLLDLKPGQTLLELGSGDGRLVKRASRSGIKVIGYELNPLLLVISWIRTRSHRQNVKLYLKNYKHTNWPTKIDAIYWFGSAKDSVWIADKLSRYQGRLTFVSYGFEIPGLKPSLKRKGLIQYRLNS